VALDVLVLDLAEARGEQVARRREALDVLVEGHEVPFAFLEDHAHLLGRQQVQILERVEIFRALRGATGEARCARRRPSTPTRQDFIKNGRWSRTSRRSWLRFANAAVGGFGTFGSASVLVLSCRLVAWSARRAARSIIVLASSSQVSSGRARA
jgi:hypothetical protein